MKDKIFEIFDEMGIHFTKTERESNRDFDLCDYLQDSFSIIIFATIIEEKLGIELDSDVLKKENFHSINTFAEILSAYVKE